MSKLDRFRRGDVIEGASDLISMAALPGVVTRNVKMMQRMQVGRPTQVDRPHWSG